MYLCRLITLFGLLLILLGILTLSASLAYSQSAERERCPSSPRSSQQDRSLTENRHYGVGHRVGSPISVDPLQGWHVEKYRIAPGAPDGRWFNFSEIDGQIFTDLRQSNGRVAFDHEHKSSYTLPIEAWMQNSPRHKKVSNPNYCNDKTFNRGCGDCFFERVTVTVNIEDVPETPPQPKAPRVTGVHGSLTASWDLVEINPKISSHDVRYRISFKPFANGPQGVTGTSATIENLNYQKNYQVSIRATNSLGDSPWSATTPAMTTPPLPKPPPPLAPTEPEPEPEPEPDPTPEPEPDPKPKPKPRPRPDPEPDPEPEPDPQVEATPIAAVTLLVANFMNGNSRCIQLACLSSGIPQTAMGPSQCASSRFPLAMLQPGELTVTPLDLGTLEAKIGTQPQVGRRYPHPPGNHDALDDRRWQSDTGIYY